MRAVLNVKLSEASVTAAGRFRAVRMTKDQGALGRITSGASFPALTTTTAQLESKYKHAKVFGVTAARGRAGFKAFESALVDFLAEPTTVRILGTYRRERVILSYNRESKLIVIQSTSGELVSAWEMTPGQALHVISKGSLGGK
jgi:hypothetical protein